MTTTKKPDETPLLTCATQAEWRQWLKKNHAGSKGVWLVLAKKGAPEPTVTYAEALEVALCWGWIDGQKGAIDAHAWKQRFTPRGPKSIWSQINRDKVAQLIESGEMQPPGQAQVDAAKADGRWEAAYASPSKAEVPEALTKALAKNAKAKAFFATLKSANRYAVLFRIHHTKTPETRAKKIAAIVEMLARGETFH